MRIRIKFIQTWFEFQSMWEWRACGQRMLFIPKLTDGRTDKQLLNQSEKEMDLLPFLQNKNLIYVLIFIRNLRSVFKIAKS